MAYERLSDNKEKMIKGDSLDAFVQNLTTLYKRQLSIRNAEDEMTFNEQVLAGNMSLEQQLDYRKEQMKRVADDPDERRRIRGEVASLKDRVEQNKFTEAYTAKLSDFQSGVASIDNVIQFLTDQKKATTDPTILTTINSKLADAQQKKFELTQSLVKNNTEYATNSKSVSVIEDQITKVQGFRNSAILSGNDQLASVYDLQLQSLNQAKSNAQVTNDVLSLGAISATGAFTAISMLDAMNAKISSSGSTGPVTINGTTYANAKDFWTFKRDSYLSDSSSNGFFSSLNTEVKNDISTMNSKNLLTTNAVTKAATVFDTLATRPELANYQKQIDIYKQDVLQDGAGKVVESIVNDFNRTLDVNKAVSSITNVKSLGVNVDDAFTKILQSNAATKNAQVSGILSAAQNAMANDPSLTPEMAVQTAVSAGAGTVLSPEQAAGKTESQIAKEAVTTAAGAKGVNDPRTTVGAPTEPANTPNASGNLNAATIAALPNLTPGMRSEEVKTLQNYLIQQGFQIPAGATGFYGSQTTAAVEEFQKKNNIDAGGNPGYFGPRTKGFVSGNQTVTTPAPTATPKVQPVNPAPTVVKPVTKSATTPVASTTSSATGLTRNQKKVYDQLVAAGAPTALALSSVKLIPN